MKRALAAVVTLAVIGGSVGALAQRVDPRKPTVLVVGPPQGPAPMMRIDARRTGLTTTKLPTGTLRPAWTKALASNVEHPPLAGSDGLLAVVTSRGDVSFLDEAGEERVTVKIGSPHAGPAALTSDGTVVFAAGSEVIGVRHSSLSPRFTTRIGGELNARAAPLPLDDGGVVIATKSDLVVLDGEGNLRARIALPEEPAQPLVAAGEKVLIVTVAGNVLAWSPGREAMRIGSFGAPVEGGVALADGALLGVIEGNQLAEVDIAHGGGRSTRSLAAQGIFLGPPAIRGTNTILLSLTQTRGFVLTLDAAGQETFRAPISSFTPPVLPDGGVPNLIAPPHVAPLVDSAGTVAFATTEGHVGVVGPDGAVDTIGELLCAKGGRAGVVGLTPFAKAGFAVTCESGTVALITGR